MSNEVDYSMYGGNSRPQEGRSEIIGESINNLNSRDKRVFPVPLKA